MEKITIQDIPNDNLKIRYVFTLTVPSELAEKEGSTIRKITGEVEWPKKSDIKLIQKDLERRYGERQEELNQETTPTPIKLSWDGVNWK